MNPRFATLFTGCLLGIFSPLLFAQVSNAPVNLAVVSTASASEVSGDTSTAALNDNFTPRNSRDNRRGSYGNWPNTGTQWVQYDWSQPVSTKQIEVYWWDDHQGVRVPNRTTSELYTPTPTVNGLKSLAVNGEKVLPKIENGYAVITREWKAGDKIELELPMEIQVVRADEHIKADRGHLALRYGPLIYNVETTDQPKLDLAPDLKSLATEWRGDLLGGVLAIKGKWSDGSPLLAIPNYARQNRGAATTAVWMKE